MNPQQIRTTAEKIYNEQQASRQQRERMGMNITSLMTATVDEIVAHIQMVEDVARETGTMLNYQKFDYGTSREQVEAVAAAKIKATKRSAGARALSAKYGKSAAERIIASKTGKHITLQN